MTLEEKYIEAAKTQLHLEVLHPTGESVNYTPEEVQETFPDFDYAKDVVVTIFETDPENDEENHYVYVIADTDNTENIIMIAMQ